MADGSEHGDVILCVCRQGAFSELKVVGNPRAAERLCDDEDDSDAVSVCLLGVSFLQKCHGALT